MFTQFDVAIFSKRLQEIREIAGYNTQKEFADAIGISTPAVNYYESGKRLPDARTLVLLASFFNCSIDWLLGISDNLNPDNSYIEKVTGLNENSIQYLSTDCCFKKEYVPAHHFIFNLLLSEGYIETLVNNIHDAVESRAIIENPGENISQLLSKRYLHDLEEANAHPSLIQAAKKEVDVAETLNQDFNERALRERIDLCQFRFVKAMDSFFDKIVEILSGNYDEWLHGREREKISAYMEMGDFEDHGINETQKKS